MSSKYPPSHDLHTLAALFPHVDPDVIASIVRHELPGAELYKLDEASEGAHVVVNILSFVPIETKRAVTQALARSDAKVCFPPVYR